MNILGFLGLEGYSLNLHVCFFLFFLWPTQDALILVFCNCLKTFRCFSKDWDVTEYGVCELADIISEIPDTTICLSQQDNEMVICIPKRGMSMYIVFTVGKEIADHFKSLLTQVYSSDLDILILHFYLHN